VLERVTTNIVQPMQALRVGLERSRDEDGSMFSEQAQRDPKRFGDVVGDVVGDDYAFEQPLP
jgi:hypothetical protein